MTVINNQSASFEMIKKDLQLYIAQRPDAAKWKDLVDTAVGTTLVELIAGLGAFKSYKELMSQRESTLETALNESNIFELAFNRGYLVPPTNSAEYEILVQAQSPISIAKGDMVGTIGDGYFLYAMNDLLLEAVGSTGTLTCVAGIISTFTMDLSSDKPFKKLNFEVPCAYAATQLEEVLIDGFPIELVADIPTRTDNNTFLLRRIRPYRSVMYTGNGKIGWYRRTGTLTYRVVSYGVDMLTAAQQTPTMVIPVTITTSTQTRVAEILDAQELKVNALYYPLDGRIVRSQDYETFILKYFASSVRDVYSYNDNPTQQVVVLQNTLGDYQVAWTPEMQTALETSIAAGIDAKRAMGMDVHYTWQTEADGVVITFPIRIVGSEYDARVANAIKLYLDNLCYKFLRTAQTIYTPALAIELSSAVGVGLFPATQERFSLQPKSFIKAFAVAITLVDPNADLYHTLIETPQIKADGSLIASKIYLTDEYGNYLTED